MSVYEAYKCIVNSVQLEKVELVSMNCTQKKKERTGNVSVSVRFKRKVELIDDKTALIFLHTKVGEGSCPFDFEIVYSGKCKCKNDSTTSTFEEYAEAQVIPLLLPYVRECIASTLARMGLPIFTIPTIDVLNSFEANDASKHIED
ncbi:protein-export chaperone SecB [Terrilactibacillus laevilacticus]|uniref:Protein-export chaperone SecB n=1 Tax=Terrilactibacillus laevilacticus TaxID=1380157 RepID=A0ABW5PV59_9BACI|nr:protein-export chaperone SecB [Terrilactibacillus laevilacticus]